MLTLTPTTLGKFCREIAGGLSPVDILLGEWGLTASDYAALRESPGYQHEMTVIVQEMQELGPDAGYIYRMKALSEEFIGDILTIMRAPDTGAGTKVELIKFCADLARLKEKPAAAGAAAAGARGPSVVFHFGAGLPIHTMTLVPDGTLGEENGNVHESGLRSSTDVAVVPYEPPQQIQGAAKTVEQMGRPVASGFQFDPATD